MQALFAALQQTRGAFLESAPVLAYHSDAFVLPLPPGHSFPMSKYRLLREAAEATLPGVRVREAQPARQAARKAWPRGDRKRCLHYTRRQHSVKVNG